MKRGPRPLPVDVRFWRFVEKTDTCWLWTGSKQKSGHGRFGITRSHSDGAHRVAYELAVGPIPAGLHIDHLCGNPMCVNPAHLEPVTALENMRRAAGRRSHCSKGHPYSEANLYLWKGKRYCRACRRAVEARRRRT